MQELTLRALKKTKFKELYFQLLSRKRMVDQDVVKLLAISVLFLNHKTPDVRRLGYRVVLFYANISGKYEALYDVALNSGLHPVSALIGNSISKENNRSESFLSNIIYSYVDTFRDRGMVLTEQQDALGHFVQSEYKNSSVIVAPTSYGKSELIIKSVRDNLHKGILILVPSKALLAQTKKRLIDSDLDGLGKIVTHPEMYSVERPHRVFVLTQERLNRLLEEYPSLYFDMVFVDEAHNLLDGDRRNELLATMLCILGARNRSTAFKFLTPFLCDELNVRVRYLDMEPKGFRIDEYVKSERFYACDFRDGRGDGKLRFYDHFLDEWLVLNESYKDCFELIAQKSLSKNIIYGNKKKNIEAFAVSLAATLPPVECPLISRACDELQESFDKKYRLIACLRKGVMYHHGSIPDTVRLYLESLFSKSKRLKYLVCNSTLLEGVNLPIERLFLFDYTKGRSNLTPSQFKNLIGRVNRFSEVFASDAVNSLKKLEPSIYLLGVDGFTRRNANLASFYKNSAHVSQVERDDVSNVMLQATDIVEGDVERRFHDAVARLENLHPGVVKGRECKYVATKVGKLLIANSVSEIDVFEEEYHIEKKISTFLERGEKIADADRLMRAIKDCFIDHFDQSREYSDLKRLSQPAALSFYAMLLDWKLKKYGIKETIRLTLRYWRKLVEDGGSDYVFVGSWGDTKYENSQAENWVRISTKDEVERINLAIVRLKEEDDFFDHKIFRFVEVLEGVGAIDDDFYRQIKYGTANEIKIKLIREGFSRGLVDLVLDKYPSMVKVKKSGDVELNPALLKSMIKENESELLIFEARMNVKSE